MGDECKLLWIIDSTLAASVLGRLQTARLSLSPPWSVEKIQGSIQNPAPIVSAIQEVFTGKGTRTLRGPHPQNQTPPAIVLYPFEFAFLHAKNHLWEGFQPRPILIAYFTEYLTPQAPASIKAWSSFQTESSERMILIDLYQTPPSSKLPFMDSLLANVSSQKIMDPFEQQPEVKVSFSDFGSQMDDLLSSLTRNASPWAKNAHSIRILFIALWGFIDEHLELLQPEKKILFSFIAEPTQFNFRIRALISRRAQKFFQTFSPFAPTSQAATQNFTQGFKNPAELLLQIADFLRLHWNPSAPEQIEIRTGLLASHFFMGHLVSSSPHQVRSTFHFWREPLPMKAFSSTDEDSIEPTLTPLDPQAELKAVLDLFQQRFFQAKYQIRQFEMKIAELEKTRSSSLEIDLLRKKVLILKERETEWIQKLSDSLTLEHGKKSP